MSRLLVVCNSPGELSTVAAGIITLLDLFFRELFVSPVISHYTMQPHAESFLCADSFLCAMLAFLVPRANWICKPENYSFWVNTGFVSRKITVSGSTPDL